MEANGEPREVLEQEQHYPGSGASRGVRRTCGGSYHSSTGGKGGFCRVGMVKHQTAPRGEGPEKENSAGLAAEEAWTKEGTAKGPRESLCWLRRGPCEG